MNFESSFPLSAKGSNIAFSRNLFIWIRKQDTFRTWSNY